MGCGCKGNVSNDNSIKFGDLTVNAKLRRVGFYTLKVFAFMLAILALPIINIAIIWFIFQIVVLNQSFSVKEIVFKIMGKALTRNDDDDDDDDYYDLDELNEDDVTLLDVDEITHEIK
jgi:hypothetical protein